MGRRKTFEISGVTHRSAPIPMAAQVGSFFRSSGIPPTDPGTGAYPAGGPAQVRQAFANALALLAVAGLSSDDVVYLDVYLGEETLRPAVNDVWLEWYPDPNDRPARHISIRPMPGQMLVQLQVEAVAGEDSK